MAMKTSRQGSGETLSVDMTPLIDVTFLLLIFFMTVSTFNEMERMAEVELPVAFQARIEEDVSKKRLVINVEEDGNIVMFNQDMNMAQFEQSLDKYSEGLRELEEKTGAAPIVVRGDQDAEYRHVKNVLAKVYELRFERILFAAYQPDEQN